MLVRLSCGSRIPSSSSNSRAASISPLLKIQPSYSTSKTKRSLHSTCSRSRQLSPLSNSQLDKPFFAFDLDGVVKQGEVILPSGRRALKKLKEKKIPFVIVTNSGGSGEVQRAAKLTEQIEVEVSIKCQVVVIKGSKDRSREIGIRQLQKIAPEQLVLSHTVMKSLSHLYKDEPILMIGGPDTPVGQAKEVMKSYGFNSIFTSFDLHASNEASYPFNPCPSEQLPHTIKNIDFSKINFKAVFVFHDSRDWGRDLQFMLDLLRSRDGVWGSSKGLDEKSGKFGIDGFGEQIPVYFSHNDLVWQNQFPLSRLGQGSFKLALESIYKAMTGKELISKNFGKPHLMTYEYADALLREQGRKLGFEEGGEGESMEMETRRRVWMIGDNPESDIAGANAFNWSSALVSKTGVYRLEDGDPTHPATIIVDDVEMAVEEAFRIQRERAQKL